MATRPSAVTKKTPIKADSAKKTPIKDDIAKMSPIKEVKRASLPKDVQDQTENLLVLRRDTLEQLGIDKATINKLLKAKVVAHHKFLTCGDYNL